MILDMQLISAAGFAAAMALGLVVYPSPSNTLTMPVKLEDPSQLVPVGPEGVIPAVLMAAPEELADQVSQVHFCAHFVRVSDGGNSYCDELARGLALHPELVAISDDYRAATEVFSGGIEEAHTVLADYCRARWASSMERGHDFDTARCALVDIPIATEAGSL